MAIALIYLRPGLYSSFIDPVSCPRCGGFGVYSHPFNECESVDCSDCDGSGVFENPAPSSAPEEDGGGAGGRSLEMAPTFMVHIGVQDEGTFSNTYPLCNRLHK